MSRGPRSRALSVVGSDFSRTILAFVCALVAASTAVHASRPANLSVAWLRDGRVETRTTSGVAVPTVAPLGSTWKLFVFAYAVENNVSTPVYRCGVPRKDGDEYCCDPGQSIDRDHALARSCGRFFDPTRLNIDPADWTEFWRVRAGADMRWLLDLKHFGPATDAPIDQLLRVLATVPPDVRATTERALLPSSSMAMGAGRSRRSVDSCGPRHSPGASPVSKVASPAAVRRAGWSMARRSGLRPPARAGRS